ncbi:MAG: cobalamin-dependent protein [Lentihominibacter sp.]|nr:cobalamin-dependent protein [Clostridiales bacterium]MDD6647974.1 cobalamin-dependent protein [Bacillota bacterium]MDY2680058.1 cobalamin-dependent protein [Lentihominibacter sp.]
MAKIFKKIIEAIEDGEIEEVVELVEEALEDEEEPTDIMNKGLIEGMNVVGELFKEGELFVPEVLMSANAMEAGMELIRPYLKADDVKVAGKIIFCTVEGDLHDIGKKLCVMMLEGAGYEVVDLGVDVGVSQIIDAVKEHSPDLVAMSAMLTTTMVTMDQTVEALKENGLDAGVKVMVGGAPLSGDYAAGISANYSEDAITCVELADRLMA